jgi:hypothetical protein
MAEESILLRVGIDQKQINDSTKAIVEATKQIDELKKANKELAAAEEDNTEAIVKNNAAIKSLNGEVRENERVLIAANKANKVAEGSIKQQREQLARLQQQYVGLSREERENTKVGGALQKQIKSLSDSLKDQEAQIGVTNRNVGNYSEGFQKAIGSTGQFGKSFGVVNNLFKTSPIGLVVTAIALLVGKVTQAQGVTDGFAKVLTPINVIFESIVGVLQNLGGRILPLFENALKNPVETLKNLGNIILENILNRFRALGKIAPAIGKILKGEFTEGFKDLGNAVLQAGTGVENLIDKTLELGKSAGKFFDEAIKKAQRLNELTREIEEAQNNQVLNEARLNREYEEALELAKDLTVSSKQREKAAQEAIRIQNQLTKDRLDILEREIEQAQIKASLNDTDRKAQFELNKLIAQRDEIEANRLKTIRGVQRTLAQINKQEADEAKRRREEVARAASEAEKERLRIEAEAQKERNDRFKEELKQRAQDISAQAREDINQLREDFITGGISREEYIKQLEDLEGAGLVIKREALLQEREEILTNTAITEELRLQLIADTDKQLEGIEDAGIMRRIKQREQELSAEKEKQDELLRLAEERADAEIEAEQSVLGAAKEIFGEQSAAGRALASFDILNNTFRAAQLAQATIPPPFGQVIAAANIVAGLARVSKVNSQPLPKFEDGGGIDISGPSHAGGGVPVSIGGQPVAEVEGGEKLFVMKKSAAGAIEQLSKWNQLFGGNSWTSGGRRYLADGGAVARASTPGALSMGMSLAEQMKRVTIVTKITDLNRVNDEVQQVRASGDLR